MRRRPFQRKTSHGEHVLLDDSRHRTLFLGILFLVGACGAPPRDGQTSLPVTGGSSVSNTQLGRLGFYRFGNEWNEPCTATVLSSSRQDNHTWLLTSAWCTTVVNRTTTVTFLQGDNRTRTVADVEAFEHPQYSAGLFWSRHDLGLLSVPTALPVTDADGAVIPEFRRAIYSGPINALSGLGQAFGSEYNCIGYGCSIENPLAEKMRHELVSFAGAGYGNISMQTTAYFNIADVGSPWIYTDGNPGPPERASPEAT